MICGAVSAGISAASGGSLGDILQAAVFGYVVPQIWGAVGKAIEGVSRIGQALIHGVVNGAITAARGGRFLAGFASGVLGKVTSFASDILSHGDKVIDTAIVAAGGCAGAVIAKGSCANGAITAAFANMYNKWGDKHNKGGRTYIEGRNGELRPETINDASWIYDVVGGVAGVVKRAAVLSGRYIANNYKTLYRIVDDVELADIIKTGKFIAKGQYEGKQFVDNFGDAKQLQKVFSKFFGGNQTIVKGRISKSTFNKVDRIPFSDKPNGTAITIKPKHLSKIKPQF